MQKDIPQHTPRLFASQSLVIILSKPLQHQPISISSTPQPSSPAVTSHLKGKGANKDTGQEDGILPENGTLMRSVIQYLESYQFDRDLLVNR